MYVRGRREPRQPSSAAAQFVGRGPELARLTGLLSQHRLVTVQGTGGVGKTTLALRAAAQVAPKFADGVCVTRLSSLRDPELLPHTVAGRLKLASQDARTVLQTVLDYLRDREMLLVLDTCEHLVEACAGLAEAILERTSRVTVLVTSRQPLNVKGENICPLLPFRVPSADDAPSPGDATDLFARRAAAATGNFTLTAENRRDVIAICERLDGIPLAIELAAVRLQTLSLPELARLLTDRITTPEKQRPRIGRLFSRDRRPGAMAGDRQPRAINRLALGDLSQADARHRALQATIGWSYELCTPAEQVLWERLSVFAGAFSTEAATEVCADRDLPRDGIPGMVAGLVDKSALVRQEAEADDRDRYRFLDTIRQFGAERLVAAGTEIGAQDRLIAHYRARAQYFGDHLLDDDQLERYLELSSEHANLRAVLELTLETGDHARVREGAALAADLYGYWAISGKLREGGYWLGKVVERFPGRTRERARALAAWSYLTAFQGEADKSVADATEAIAIADELGDGLTAGRGYMYLNLAYAFSGQVDEAIAAGTEAERRFDALGDRIGQICLDTQMAHLYQIAEKFGESAYYYERGLRRSGNTQEKYATGYLYAVKGMALSQQPGQEAECADVAARGLTAKYALDDLLGIGYALEVFAWLADRAGRHERASWLLGAADYHWERTGQRLSGTPALIQFHLNADAAAREALGDQRFEALYAEGKFYPRDDLVRLAITDADSLPPVADGEDQLELG
jgi:non-specific serine/threonine protein kinase